MDTMLAETLEKKNKIFQPRFLYVSILWINNVGINKEMEETKS